MKLIGKAQEIGEMILRSFREGTVPEALAQMYFVDPGFPSSSYSVANKLIISLTGMLRGKTYSAAGGFKYWLSKGRTVRKGEKAIHVLAPLQGKREEEKPDTGEKRTVNFIYGFRSVPVFDISQTDGDPVPEMEGREEYIRSLPYLDVASHWNIQVVIDTYTGSNGYYSPGMNHIGLAVKNLSTWAHELCHTADERIQGQLKPGQDAEQEIVAELGGAILLSIAGEENSADLGGCLEYIEFYAGGDQGKAIQIAAGLLERTSAVVAHILETAEQLQMQPVAA